jgi:RNA polymerase sigma factor (sigma-70 family)
MADGPVLIPGHPPQDGITTIKVQTLRALPDEHVPLSDGDPSARVARRRRCWATVLLYSTSYVDYLNLSDDELVRVCAVCKDSAPWEVFVQRFQPLIAGAVYRAIVRAGGLSMGNLEDLVQEAYTKLYDPGRNVLAGFVPRHPGAVRAFLRAVTMNLVYDHLKAVGRQKWGANQTDNTLDNEMQPLLEDAAGSSSAIERGILLKEMDLVLRESGNPNVNRDRRIFWFHYRLGMSAREIAELPSLGLSVKGVESTLLRLTRLIRGRLAKLPSERAEPSDAAKENKVAESL